ncbi:MAG: hypothetical protein KF866_00880 [Phycisphaeraceae bacterium]|nr:hypothetical protein [Phycisphaeraceae bacterium]MCW5755102.1 hypothetical protein [Phycisphaeraceae bacterium]
MPPARVVAWLLPRQIDLVREVCRLSGLTLEGAGSPGHGQVRAAAEPLGVRAVDDLRHELSAGESDFIILFAPGDFGADPGGADTTALLNARSRNAHVVALEPIPASVAELASGRWMRPRNGVMPSECLRPFALFAHGRTVMRAAEALSAFGEARTVLIENLGPDAAGTLGARLHDAMHCLITLLGEPELIDASCVGPIRGPALHTVAGERLRDLAGDLTAHVRYADGRSAVLWASDQIDRLHRRVTLLGPEGRFSISDAGYRWTNRQGKVVDTWETDDAGDARILADALHDLAADPRFGLTDPQPMLASAQAALLSVRTGQAEAPATIRRIFAPSV